MTVSVDDYLRIREYAGDDSANPRPVPFKFLANDDLRVTRTNADGSETVLVRGTHYSVAGAGAAAGGSVTPLAPIAVGTNWRIEGYMPLGQPTDYTAGDDFPAESHERGLDRAMIGLQENRRDLNETDLRAIKVRKGQVAPDLEIAGLIEDDILIFKGGRLRRLAREDFAGKFYAGDGMGRFTPASGTGADAALRGDLAANGGVIVGTEGGSTAQDDINGIRGPYPIGAAGDGAANDKAFIDAVNIAGQEVDLMGKDYAYVGTVDLAKARFRNGRIISSTMGTLDFRQTTILFPKVISVGAAGTIKRGEYVMPYLRQLRIVGTVEVQCLEKNTPNDATGSMAFDVADFWHPEMARILWKSPTLALVPTATEMPGKDMTDLAAAKAADYAFLLNRFSASMYLTGADDLNGSYGISAIGGFNTENILLDDHTRYNAAVNWLGSHASKTKGGGRVSLVNSATIGGVWTLTLIDVQVYFGGTRVMLSYPLNGGGIFAEGCNFYKNGTTELHIYHPKVTPNSNLPKYGISGEKCHFLFEPDGANANRTFIFGPYLHGLFLTDCTGAIPDVSYDGVTMPRTQVGGRIDYGRPKVRNADPANTALTVGSTQPGIIGNPVSGSLFFVSKGGEALYRGVDVAASVCSSYFVEESGGHNICGLNAKEDVDDSKATAKAYRAFASRGNLHRPNVTNPRAGSIDGAAVALGSDMHLYDNTGVSPDVTLNTYVAGNGISG